jgi:NhaP-type Na+/H+ or K+/H+ antiporter
MNPEFLMLCFLPLLIFESAFTCDWHTFKMQLVRILMLAMPVLLAATYLTAYVFYYVLNYKEDMSFSACLMFGAMISATDPVAVVSLLKELGTPKSIGTLIEGESLLNDGTAVVVFQVTRTFVQGEVMTGGEIVGKFCKMSFGGPALGLAFGLILEKWLSRIHNVPELEVNLTLCFAYLTFFVAEHPEIHVSGILALVALGLYMTQGAKNKISTESEHAVHNVWG